MRLETQNAARAECNRSVGVDISTAGSLKCRKGKSAVVHERWIGDRRPGYLPCACAICPTSFAQGMSMAP
jgi:hypothetical protein